MSPRLGTKIHSVWIKIQCLFLYLSVHIKQKVFWDLRRASNQMGGFVHRLNQSHWQHDPRLATYHQFLSICSVDTTHHCHISLVCSAVYPHHHHHHPPSLSFSLLQLQLPPPSLSELLRWKISSGVDIGWLASAVKLHYIDYIWKPFPSFPPSSFPPTPANLFSLLSGIINSAKILTIYCCTSKLHLTNESLKQCNEIVLSRIFWGVCH